MNREPETYEEIVLQKRCIELTKYYELSKEEVNEIFEFLCNNATGKVKGGLESITLEKDRNNKNYLNKKKCKYRWTTTR